MAADRRQRLMASQVESHRKLSSDMPLVSLLRLVSVSYLTHGATLQAGPSFARPDAEGPSITVPCGDSVASPREIDQGEQAMYGGHGEPLASEPPSIIS